MSTGKLLSNMHRVGPNCSMQWLTMGAMFEASSSEPMGLSRRCQSNPTLGIPMPPIFMYMLGCAAAAAMPLVQVALTSSMRPA